MDVKGQERRALLRVLVGIGCILAVLPAVSVGAVADAGATGAMMQEAPEERDLLDDADEIHIDVRLTENGSATFEITYRYHLEEENTSVDAWERLRDDVDSNPEAYAMAEASDWDEVRADAENETEREMELSDADVSTDESNAPVHTGQVEFSFEWSSFATVVINEIEAGDALSGLTLVDDTSLRIAGPEGYVVYAHEPSADDSEPDSVTWEGEGTEFDDDQPRVVFIEDSNEEGESDDADETPAMPWLTVIGALALLAIAGAIGWWIRHRRDGGTGSSPAETPTATPPNATAPAEADGPPPELLSNEERVLRLLEERGGRIKQQEVISELDWTEAKTSQVVSGLRGDDEIEVFRIGRENVLALPEKEEEGDDAEE